MLLHLLLSFDPLLQSLVARSSFHFALTYLLSDLRNILFRLTQSCLFDFQIRPWKYGLNILQQLTAVGVLHRHWALVELNARYMVDKVVDGNYLLL